MNHYEIIQPPFSLNFREMSKSELKSYYQWFMDNIPIRLFQLTQAINFSQGYEDWTPDFSPESLIVLGQWFAENVEQRKKTAKELEAIKSKLVFPIEISEDELTDRTFSLAYDIGIYLSQVFLENNPSLQWGQFFGSKKSIDYGQPVLAGFGKLTFNPVYMMVTMAYSLADKTRQGDDLIYIYNIWIQDIG